MPTLKPFRTVPADQKEWSRWMQEQELNDDDLDVDSVTTDDLTVNDTATVDELDAGSITLTDTGWDDITADLSAGRAVGANAPTWTTFRDGLSLWEFSAGTMNEIWINFHILHDYKRNTKIYPHIHWTTASTATSGTVRWGMEYSFAKGHDQEAFPASTTLYLEYTFTENKQYQHFISEVTDAQAFGAGDIETDGILLCRVFRDAGHANDTFTGTTFGITADIHFEVGQVTTPNKAAPFF